MCPVNGVHFIINEAVKFMKKHSIVLNVVLSMVVSVFLSSCCTTEKNEVDSSAKSDGMTGVVGTRIVFINTDTLMNNYLLAIELNEAFLKKQEEMRTELNVKARSLDQEANEFQRKLQNNGFLSEARAVDARDQLLVKQENLRKLQQEMMDRTVREQNELNRQLFDKITSFLKEYNKDNKSDIVLSTQLGGTVLYSEKGYDITNDVVRLLNEEYKSSSGK